MKAKEIIEGDFEISKFMGYTYPSISNRVFRISYEHLHCYHKDWRLLMPVVEKINRWHMDTLCKKMDFYLLNQSICSSIDMVWEGCIEFIQWYNTQNQK